MDLAGNAEMGAGERGMQFIWCHAEDGLELSVPPPLRDPSSAPNPRRIAIPVLRRLTGGEHQSPSSAESACSSLELLARLPCHQIPGDCARVASEGGFGS